MFSAVQFALWGAGITGLTFIMLQLLWGASQRRQLARAIQASAKTPAQRDRERLDAQLAAIRARARLLEGGPQLELDLDLRAPVHPTYRPQGLFAPQEAK